MIRTAGRVVAAALLAAATTLVGATPTIAADHWAPTPGDPWQWQLAGTLDLSVDVPIYDIDGQENTAATVAALHAQGKRAICYMEVGGWESYRPDADAFPKSVLGRNIDGWAGEKWLDIRQLDVLLPIMDARIADCASKGFDAVEPDLMDGFSNSTGFPLTYADQIAYNRAIADLVHSHGLSVALKNDPEQVADLEPFFDFAVVEECWEYRECDAYLPFVAAGKAVLHVEYRGQPAKWCPKVPDGFSSMKKRYSLNAWRIAC